MYVRSPGGGLQSLAPHWSIVPQNYKLPKQWARLSRISPEFLGPLVMKWDSIEALLVQFQDNELNKPWITEGMKNEIMKKHKLYQKAKKSNDENDWKEFKDQKARVATIIREAKLEYIGSHPEEVRNILKQASFFVHALKSV